MKAPAEDLVVPTYLGKDIVTDITVTTEKSDVPLDTELAVETVENENIEKSAKLPQEHIEQDINKKEPKNRFFYFSGSSQQNFLILKLIFYRKKRIYRKYIHILAEAVLSVQ